MTAIVSTSGRLHSEFVTSGRLHSEFVRLLFLQTNRETGNWPSFWSFRNSAVTIWPWPVPLPTRDFRRIRVSESWSKWSGLSRLLKTVKNRNLGVVVREKIGCFPIVPYWVCSSIFGREISVKKIGCSPNYRLYYQLYYHKVSCVCHVRLFQDDGNLLDFW